MDIWTYTMRDRIRNKDIRDEVRMVSAENKVRKVRLR